MANDVKRMRYFNGLFLKEEEFNLEQDYHIRMRRLHNRYLHKCGIAWGLKVEPVPDSMKVTVKEGMALNEAVDEKTGEKISQEIILTTNKEVDLSKYEVDYEVYIYISYSEEKADIVPEKGGDKDEIHWWEKAVIEHKTEKPTNENEKIILAKVLIKLDNDQNKYIDAGSIDYTECTYAGVAAKEIETQKLTLSIEGITANLASIEGKVIDSQNGIEVKSPRTNFTGDIEVSGDLNVKGTVNKTDELEIKDNVIRVNKYAPQATPQNINGGLEVYRGGTAPNAQILWDETVDKWRMGVAGSLSDIADSLHKHNSLSTPAGSMALSVDAAGNVGIGTTTTPTQNLEVTGTIKATDIILSDGSAAGPALRFANDPDTGLFRPGENWLYFVSGNHTPMRMKETNVDIGIPGTTDKVNLSVTGNVGIGIYTHEIKAALHVDGQIYATGAIFSNQTLADVSSSGNVQAPLLFYGDIPGMAATIYVPRAAVVNVRVNFTTLILNVQMMSTRTVYFKAVLDNTTEMAIGSYSYSRDLFGQASKIWNNIELPTYFDLTEGPHVIKIQWMVNLVATATLTNNRRMQIIV